MPKEEWGTKRLCPTSGKRFYDLNKDPIVSPYTGEVVELETGRKSTVALTRDKAKEKKPETTSNDDEDVILEEDNEVEMDDDLLDEDDEDTVALDDIADVSNEDNED